MHNFPNYWFSSNFKVAGIVMRYHVVAAIQQLGSLPKISVFMGFGQTARMARGHPTAKSRIALLMNMRSQILSRDCNKIGHPFPAQVAMEWDSGLMNGRNMEPVLS
ncbi:hypothetical protein ACH5RR_030520 [Cinchona calisaya]|uniref:Uncharacterized protein n=1 Tax=Cinchona calisaya TaxID=153742 RepID=A0ABD2YXT0_9GENT